MAKVWTPPKILRWDSQKPYVFVASVIIVFIICIYLYSTPNRSQWTLPRIYLKKPHVQDTVHTSEAPSTIDASSPTEKEYLVYSPSCKIPNVSPWHPSIRHIIDKTDPLDCSEYSALTETEGNKLKLIPLLSKHMKVFNISCGYRSVYRDNEGYSDDDVGYGANWTALNEEVEITDEFIEVNCKSSNGTLFYKNFHSFIHRKADVEERCSQVPSDHEKYSILLVGIDSVSRLNMHRQFNATTQFLLDELGAVEMYGFNKVGENTFPNLIPLFLGIHERELGDVCWDSYDKPLDKCDFLWKHFANQGYRTFYAEDTPTMSSFNYVKLGFFYQPTDYYFRHFIMAYEKGVGRDRKYNCYLCVGPISETEAVLQWTQKFVTEFSNESYFAIAWLNSLTHDTLNLGSAGDHMYRKFFEDIYADNKLENTILIVMGDHGMRWGDIRKTFVGRLEERLPMLFIILPEKFKKYHPEAVATLRLNSEKLVTPFDLHASLSYLLNISEPWEGLNASRVPPSLAANYSRRALSIFHPMPEDRSCVDAYIDEAWCTCEMQNNVDREDPEVKSVADFIVETLNLLLKSFFELCSVLHLHNITESRIWGDSIPDKSSKSDIFTVVIQTMPGGGIFEGTIKYSREKDVKHEVLGSLSRLNLYGNQSSCIHDPSLVEYCYCHQNSTVE